MTPDRNDRLVERARFALAEEIGMTRAELLAVDRLVPLRRVVLRERLATEDATQPGREPREAVRIDCEDWLRPAVEDIDWPTPPDPPARAYRDPDPTAGLTHEEKLWLESVLRAWKSESDRDARWQHEAHDDVLVLLRDGSRVAVVAAEAGIVLGWITERTAAGVAVALGAVAGLALLLGAILPPRMGPTLRIAIILLVAIIGLIRVWPYLTRRRMFGG